MPNVCDLHHHSSLQFEQLKPNMIIFIKIKKALFGYNCGRCIRYYDDAMSSNIFSNVKVCYIND
jgi:hypothetical protein